MGVWLPDDWMESAPAGFPLPPLILPGPPSLLAAGREGGRDWGLGRWRSYRPQTPSFLPLPAAAARRGEGAGRRGKPRGSGGQDAG
jgi:hypothetical protein